MQFGLFMYCTVGRREELQLGMAGQNNVLYQRMLDEIADYARFADQNGYCGFGHPEHHLQIEGFEISNDPCLMAMWLGSHSERMKIVTCGFVSTANNPLQTAEKIATLDHMLKGRFGVGLVRGYQARWVENYKVTTGAQRRGALERQVTGGRPEPRVLRRVRRGGGTRAQRGHPPAPG